MGNIKVINIKNHTYYFFNDMINIEDFDSSLLIKDKKSYKNFGIFNIHNYESINSVNPLYLVIGKSRYIYIYIYIYIKMVTSI